MAGSLVLAAAIMLVVTWVFLAIIGRPFLAALGLAPDLSAYGLGFVPLFPELGAIASGNLLLGLIIVLGFVVGFVLWIPQTTILVSRGLFAWSFDRLIPERVAEVNPRTHSPVVATLIIMGLALVSVAILLQSGADGARWSVRADPDLHRGVDRRHPLPISASGDL